MRCRLCEFLQINVHLCEPRKRLRAPFYASSHAKLNATNAAKKYGCIFFWTAIVTGYELVVSVISWYSSYPPLVSN